MVNISIDSFSSIVLALDLCFVLLIFFLTEQHESIDHELCHIPFKPERICAKNIHMYTYTMECHVGTVTRTV